MTRVENELDKASDIQNTLFGPFFGKDGLVSRISQAQRGHLPYGKSLTEISLSGNKHAFEQILGDFAPKVIIATNPDNPQTLIPEQLVIAGGWCTLRTADVQNLNQGLIVNPESGQPERIISVDQVSSWIEKSASFDQIVECVGAITGSQIMAISEVRLWSERVVDKLSALFRRQLTSREEEKIFAAVEYTENKRYEMTRRYLDLVLGKGSNLTRVVDVDIWEDLKQARDQLFSAAGTQFARLLKLAARRGEYRKLIESQSLVWAMYSQPYFEQLKKREIIKGGQKFIIVEPVLHTYSSSQTGAFVIERVYHNKGIYFDENGINTDTGFIAFVECLAPNGVSVRRFLNAGAVPNVSNWEMMFLQKEQVDTPNNSLSGCLLPNNNRVLNPTGNNLFVWGVNFLPFGRTQDTLLAIIDLAERFKREKARLQAQFTPSVLRHNLEARNRMQVMTEQLREECLMRLDVLNEKLASDLKVFFSYLTEGV